MPPTLANGTASALMKRIFMLSWSPFAALLLSLEPAIINVWEHFVQFIEFICQCAVGFSGVEAVCQLLKTLNVLAKALDGIFTRLSSSDEERPIAGLQQQQFPRCLIQHRALIFSGVGVGVCEFFHFRFCFMDRTPH